MTTAFTRSGLVWLCLTATFLPHAAPAQTVEWHGQASGNWNDDDNWSTGAVPAPGDGVVIDTAVPNATLVDSPGAGAQEIILGNTGTGIMTIAGNGTVQIDGGTGNLIIAVQAGSTGTLNLGAALSDPAGAISPLALSASQIAFGAGTGTITLNHTSLGYTLASAIGGSGSLVAHAGITRLTGTNVYTGNTTISGGRLIAGSDDALSANSAFTLASGAVLELDDFVEGTIRSLSGAGSVALGNLSLLVIDGNENTTFAGTITGDGDLSYDGTGTLTLTGDSHIGGELVMCSCGAGTLNIAGGSFQADSATDISGGSLRLNSGARLVTSDLYGDGATISIDGAGSGAEVTGETLIGFASGASLDIANGGTVTSQSDGELDSLAGRSAATVSGPGSTWTVAGTLFVGDASFGGVADLTVSEGGRINLGNGTLRIGGGSNLHLGTGSEVGLLTAGNVVNDGLIAANFTDTLSLTADISGTGDLTKSGSGSLLLSGTNTFSGTTTVSGGTLVVDGSLASALTVGSEGTLSGTGSFGGGVANSGVIAPGNSIGTMTVTGPLTFAAGSFLDIETNATGQSDRIDVTGTATLTGASVRVTPEAGDYRTQTDYVILTASNPLVTTFDSVSTNSAFLESSLLYAPNSVTLRLNRNAKAFASAAAGTNQTGPAAALDAASGNASGGLADLIGSITVLSESQARNAFDQLSGSSLTALPTVQLAGTDGFGLGVQKGALRHTGLNDATAPGLTDATPLPGDDLAALASVLGTVGPALSATSGTDDRDERKSTWISGYGLAGNVDGEGDARGYVHRTAGLLAGRDWSISRETTLGVATGFARSEVDQRNSGDSARITGMQASLYGLWRPDSRDGRLTFDGAIGFGHSQYETERRISFVGVARTARGETVGHEVFGRSGARWLHEIGPYRIEPRAGLAWARVFRNAYTETGAGGANLAIAEETTYSLQSRAGLEIARDFTGRDGAVWTSVLSTAWRHEFANTDRVADAAFADAPSASFRTEGVEARRDALEIGLRLALDVVDGPEFAVGYGAQLTRGESAHILHSTLRIEW